MSNANLKKLAWIVTGLLVVCLSGLMIWLVPVFETQFWNSAWAYCVPGLILFLVLVSATCSPKWVLRHHMVVSGLLFALLGLELTCRALGIMAYPTVYRVHDRYLYEPVPFSSRTIEMHPFDGGETVVQKFNGDGRRDDYNGSAKADFVVAVYGDSFIEANYSSDRDIFTEQLKQQLKSKLKKTVVVYNCGVAGWGPDQICLRLEDEIPKLKPDLVVLSLYAGNDFNDLLRNKIFRLNSSGKLTTRDYYLSEENINQFEFASSTSRLLRILSLKIAEWQVREDQKKEKPVAKLSTFSKKKRNFTRFRRNCLKRAEEDYILYQASDSVDRKYLPRSNLNFEIAISPNTPRSKYQIALMRQVLARCARTLERQQVSTMAMVIPNRVDAIPGQAPDPKVYPNYNRKELSNVLNQCAQDAGMTCFELFPVFQAAGPEKCYFHNNLHWNASGQSLAAEFLSSKIIDHLKMESSNPDSHNSNQQRGPIATGEKPGILSK